MALRLHDGERLWRSDLNSVALDLIERHAAVGGELAREAKYAFADDVLCDLGGTAAECSGLPRKVSLAKADEVIVDVDHARTTGDRQHGVELQVMGFGMCDTND